MQQFASSEIEHEGKCTKLFPEYWNGGHLLLGNELYVYKGDDISREELYLKKRMVSFVKDLGYPRGVTPQDEASHKHLKRLTDTRQRMDA